MSGDIKSVLSAYLFCSALHGVIWKKLQSQDQLMHVKHYSRVNSEQQKRKRFRGFFLFDF